MYRDGNRINIVSQVTEYQSAEVYAQTAEDVQHVCFQFINRRIFICMRPGVAYTFPVSHKPMCNSSEYAARTFSGFFFSAWK